ncbi:MAG: glycine cleavage system protein GcvH [Paracoccaceae bacterium]|nr:glycine cleavage system protein GcvH [Paracoccaceae bacterium]MDE2913693.1 glycine cleavage system protein GcvH [Paracoccaceae bacterium]
MKYTEEHEWLRQDGDLFTVGVTEYAAEALGDVVFVELPEPGQDVSKGDEIVVVESVKAASGIEAPFDGEIVDINAEVADNPALINDDPQGAAWLFRMKAKDGAAFDALLSEEDYQAFLRESGR